MPRHHTYSDREDRPEIVGDQRFVGVNMRLEPSSVPPGYVSEAINCRFTRGVIETRKGFTVPSWANRHNLVTAVSGGSTQIYGPGPGFVGVNITSPTSCTLTLPNNAGLVVGQSFSFTTNNTGLQYIDGGTAFGRANMNGVITSLTPSTSIVLEIDPPNPGGSGVWTVNNYAFTMWLGVGSGGGPPRVTGIGGTFSWGTIYGMGVFKDPTNFREVLVVATSGGVYYTSPNNIPYPIQLPAGVTISAPVTFTQAFDKFVMHRGKTLTAFYISSVNDTWTEVSQSLADNPIDGTDAIPNGERSIFCQNRLLIPCRNDEIAASDFNDISRYAPTLQEFRVNQGSADKLVTISKFNDSTVIAFKEGSVYAISGVSGDLSGLKLDQLTDRFGLVAAKSVAQVGSDIWFLSQLGVMSIRQTETNNLQGVSMPVSEPIKPLIDRINWKYASGAVSAYVDNKYYLAVPLDDAVALGYEQAPIGFTPVDTNYAVATTPGVRYRVTVGGFSGYDNHWYGGPTVAQQVITLTTNVAVTTTSSHGLSTGDIVDMFSLSSGPSGGAWGGGHRTITVTGATTFTFTGSGFTNGTFTDKGIVVLRNSPLAPSFEREFRGSRDYVAEGDFILVVASAPAANISVKKVTVGVNNAVLVYDFMNNAWSGHDQSPGLEVKEFVVSTVANRSRLLFADYEGFIKLYEETLDEQLVMPYTDLKFIAPEFEDPLDTWQVNGGTVVGINKGISDNLVSTLAVPDAANASRNLMCSPNGQYGFYRGCFISAWSAPNTFPATIPGGVRFWSTNGLAPSIVYTASGTNVTYPSGMASIVVGTTQQITSSVTTRAYAPEDISVATAVWVSFDIATWNPSYSLSLISDGENEEFPQFAAKTKDRTKWYRPFNKASFNLTNIGGEAMDKWRQDYSLLLAGANGTGTAGETTSFYLGTTAGGVNLGLHQQVRETVRTVVKDTGVQLKITNTSGRFKLLSVIIEERKDQTRGTTVA